MDFPTRGRELVSRIAVRWLRLAGSTLKDGRQEVARKYRRKILEVVEIEPWPSEWPIVSVVIPCYNYGEYLEEAVDSALGQTLQDSEVIVVDDGSTDSLTMEVLAKLDRPRTRVIHQANTGLPGARNAGIGVATGRYICCLDADDALEETYLEKTVTLLESHPDIGFAYSWVRRFGAAEGVWEPEDFNLKKLLEYNHVSVSAVFRRQAWEAVGGYWNEMRPGYEDWEFWIRLAAHGYSGKLIPEFLLKYRKHGRSMVDEIVDQHERLVRKIRQRHARLYEDPNRAKSIAFRERQSEVESLMLNLSRPNQYLDTEPGRRQLLLILGTTPNPEHLKRALAILKQSIAESSLSRPHVISHDYSLDRDLDGLQELLPYSYHLPHFLPRNRWEEFVENYIRTRRISSVLLWKSDLGLGYWPELRDEIPHLYVAELADLSASDPRDLASRDSHRYVNMYIATDKATMEALAEVGVDRARIRLLH